MANDGSCRIKGGIENPSNPCESNTHFILKCDRWRIIVPTRNPVETRLIASLRHRVNAESAALILKWISENYDPIYYSTSIKQVEEQSVSWFQSVLNGLLTARAWFPTTSEGATRAKELSEFCQSTSSTNLKMAKIFRKSININKFIRKEFDL